MKKKFLFIVPILIIGFLIYWFWPQPTIPSIIDEGQHISQETRKLIEKDNAENKIKIQYLFYNKTNEPLENKAKSLKLDQKHDVFYVLMKPLNDNPFKDYSETYYVQASPSLAKKLVDDHPDLTYFVGPYMYGKNYDGAVLNVHKQLRSPIYFASNKNYTNPYDIATAIVYILFIILVIILVIIKILVLIFDDDDDDHSGGLSDDEAAMLATTSAMLASSVVINNSH